MTITADDVARLSEAVQGPVARPGDPGFDGEVAAFNAGTRHRPEVAVGATGAEDVAAVVRWAGEVGIPVGVQATGHGATRAIDAGVLISTARMQGLVVDPDSATVTLDAGVRWHAVIQAAAPYGLAPLNGSSGTVGAVGYVMGGGLPVMGRTFGWAADRVASFRLVTADGAVRQVDAGHDADLFWALRGGKASLGVVTSMTIGLVDVPRLFSGGVFYPGEHAPTLLHAFQVWSENLPETFNTSMALLRLPPLPMIPEPLRGKFLVHHRVAFVGEAADGERLMAPMRGLAPVILDDLADHPYTEIGHVHHDPQDPLPYQEGCAVFPAFGPAEVDAFLAAVGPDSGSPLLLAEVRVLGGALGRAPAAGSAIDHRDAAALAGFVGVPMGPAAAAIPAAMAAAVARLAPVASGRTFVNFHGPAAQDNCALPWSDATSARLRAVKAAADPVQRFRFAHTLD